ncbi:hypothetical protein [Pseudomonas sp. Ant30-3]|uniref:hypothetical protein n=1 Tax=Pseudomonas sp. Ant30-3 TaxID=1488328 RepID=UPI00048FA044|nr:hypothetical protein [Pseudomonas sp. Ant30-3]
MNEENLQAGHNFVNNGDFAKALEGWIINDRAKVTRQSGSWNGGSVGFMYAVNEGQGSQTLTLATLPQPTPGKADYQLVFLYEAMEGAECLLRILEGLGGEYDLKLVPSLKHGVSVDPSPDRLDLHLVEYRHALELDAAETEITLTFISPPNERPGMSRGLRVADVRVELVLEPLRLNCLAIDGELQVPDDTLHLCFGARLDQSHVVTLLPTPDSVWVATEAGLLVEGGLSDPDGVLAARPFWGEEQGIAAAWNIDCADMAQDIPIARTLAVRSQYTADLYPLKALVGHFRLDVVPLQEPAWYPVIDLKQSVALRVRVQSYYSDFPLADRIVTWTLKGADGKEIELHTCPTDPSGEAGYTYTPDAAGDHEIIASVVSHYKPEDARHVFKVRALQNNPWLSATFSLDDSACSWVWGNKLAYPSRGETHTVTLAFPPDHALRDSEVALHLQVDDPGNPLGVQIKPAPNELTPIVGAGLTWSMDCENLRDGRFEIQISCSELLERSPVQQFNLAHNTLAIGETKQPVRFPAVGGPALPLAVQILSTVDGVGGVPGIAVVWSRDGVTYPTGTDGWSVYSFDPVEEGTFEVSATACRPYDAKEIVHRFRVTVLGEEPWTRLVKVTLADHEPGTVGLICFRDSAPVELKIEPIGETLLNEEIYLSVHGEGEEDLGFDFIPSAVDRRQLRKEGLTWGVSSNGDSSARFSLHVCNDGLDPYVLSGRLLSRTLEGEGVLKFDDKELAVGSTAYPCFGGEHTLHFTPKTASPLTALKVAAKWAPPSSTALDVILDPEEGHEEELNADGIKWQLDCRASLATGESGLSLAFEQLSQDYPPLPLSLGHHRMQIMEVREASFDPIVGQTVWLELRTQSYYTQRTVQDIEVAFKHGATEMAVLTAANGWARFPFTPTQPGDVAVIATVNSPYDGLAAPAHTFNVKVLAARDAQSASPTAAYGTMLKDED